MSAAGPTLAQTAAAQAQSATDNGRDAQANAPATVQELVVTAQKREENIRDVGMSIQAESGDRLNKLGIRDTNDLQKIVPGFQATPTYYGTYVFTIRGVGFQDTSLAGNPTVSVYSDEVPLPFSVLTNGATLDLERVEVLKGPQGTVFGNNATGGAINYIARKPTDRLIAGADVSYGRFNDADIMGFVSGPITSTLSARVALRLNKSDEWQKAYFSRKGDSFGGKDFLNGRAALQWEPTDWFKGTLTVNAWKDRGWSQLGQLYGIAALSPLAPLAPAIANYPLAPRNNRAADFNTCVNNSPFDPIQNQELGVQLSNQNPTLVNPPQLSQGPGSIAQTGGQPTSCQPARKNNEFISAALRMEFDLGNDMTLTTLSSAQSFSRKQAIDGAGMAIQDYQSLQHGKIESFFQEVRISGNFGGKGSWLVGANYGYDQTWDQFLQTYNASTASPTLFAYNADLGVDFGFPLGPTKPTNLQETDTYAAYAHAEFPILENLIAVGGIRYTEYSKRGGVCGNDSGDGSWAYVAYQLQILAFNSPSPVLSPPNSCASTGPGPTFNSPPNGELFYSRLKENNVSWQAGLNWKFSEDQLVYVNISKGYKAGSFPTVALSTFQQTRPVIQEALLSYELGAKLLLMERSLQLNGAAFYYDYTNKSLVP